MPPPSESGDARPRRVAIVSNRRSGAQQADAQCDELVAAFERHGVQATLIDVTDRPALDAALRSADSQRYDAFVAAGGDGTINTVANALAGSGIPMGIVPLGTFNYVARRYGLPDEPDAAADVVVTGRTIGIAAGEVSGRLFLNNCSLGLYTSIIDARERHKRMFGRNRVVAVLSAIAAVLTRHARPLVRIEHDGASRQVRASLVFVGVNPLQLDGLDGQIAAQVEAGALAIVLVRAIDAGRLIRFAWKSLAGAMIEAPEIEAVVTRAATLSVGGRRVRVVMDGEVVRLPAALQLRFRPDAVRLRVPVAVQATDAGDAHGEAAR